MSSPHYGFDGRLGCSNLRAGQLFIDLEMPKRLRIEGEESASSEDPLTGSTVGARPIARVKAGAIYPNCPRHIPRMQLIEPSIHSPRAASRPPEPARKGFPELKDAVHKRQRTYGGADK
jgi:hypothetical protein